MWGVCLREVVYSYEEFKSKVRTDMPIHHNCVGRYVDKHGIIYRMVFKVYGISKAGHIIIFKTMREIDTLSREFAEKYGGKREGGFLAVYDEFVKKYAEPLGSTEGELIE